MQSTYRLLVQLHKKTMQFIIPFHFLKSMSNGTLKIARFLTSAFPFSFKFFVFSGQFASPLRLHNTKTSEFPTHNATHHVNDVVISNTSHVNE
jgi:hypothetical protein